MSKKTIGAIIALVILVLAILFCSWAGQKINEKLNEINPDAQKPSTNEPTSPPTDKIPNQQTHLALGNPSGATSNTSNPDNYLLENNFYALSYNRQKGIPNWVSWRLAKDDFGETDRQNDFRPDSRLPDGWKKVTPSDYSGSGFDRGHLCPSADRSNSVKANSETFLMTNMSPQTHDLNAGPWEKLESYSRSLARRNVTLYIIAGQYGEKGKIKNKITVPTNFWKIIVVLPDNGDVSTINQDTRIIAVDMPNSEGVQNENWRKFRTTVLNIEQRTNYNFFSNLPENVRNSLKTKVDVKQ